MVTLRAGNPNDVHDICELLIDTWRNCYKGFMSADFLGSLNVDKQIQRHTSYMLKGAKYVIAEDETNGMLGFSSYGKNRMEEVDCEMELYTLYVNRNGQGQGIGGAMLNHILKNLEHNQIAVSVFQENPFKRFYTKNAFVKIGEEEIEMGTIKLMGEVLLKTI